MAIETTCGGCGKQLSVGDEHAGRRARCPACGQIYTIPSPGATSPDGAAPYLGSGSGGPPNLPTTSANPQSLNNSFAETTGSPSGANPSFPATGPVNQNVDQFWMRSTEGTEYGPVDRTTLERWFNEGRVGPGYMIRQSETGMWQGAEIFKPSSQPIGGQIFTNLQNSANPYANAGASPNIPTYGQMYPKPDQSALVLAFGILSWFMCPIFGIVAWIMGNSGLHDIRLGLVDPANKGLMQAGYYIGMVNVIMWIVCGGGYFVLVALAVLLGAMN